jgi:hypothetical protein
MNNKLMDDRGITKVLDYVVMFCCYYFIASICTFGAIPYIMHDITRDYTGLGLGWPSLLLTAIITIATDGGYNQKLRLWRRDVAGN